jgi:hypothetical protein
MSRCSFYSLLPFSVSPRLRGGLLFVLLVLLPAFSQDASTGAVRGMVSDAFGGRLRAAIVVIVNDATGLRFSTAADSDGRYAFELLPPGNYSGRAEYAGMSPQLSPQLHVEVGGSLQLDFVLQIAGAKETVTVSGAPPLVETQPAAISALLDERAIGDLPLNGRRFTDLALLAPGVTQDPRGLASGSNGDLAFGGIRGYQSSFLVDGADNNNAFFSQARGRYRAPYQFSNEVVQEFRVSSNTYGAELGRAGGAVVNVITKSGSNHFHGTSFYYIRDSSMDAQHPFMDMKPNDRQQQFGFTFGGPIKRNRIFFFGGFDAHVFHVPTLVRFLNGSPVLVPQKGQEPLHHGDYEDSDKPLVFAAAQQLNGMAGSYRSALLGNTGFIKLDMSLTPRNFLSARLNTSRYYGSNNVFFDPASPITTFAMSDNGEENVATQSASLSLTSSVSARLISHLRAQFSHDLQESSSNSADVRTRISDVIDGFGRSSILPRRTREHRFHVTETLSLESGRHSWKFGGDAMLTWINNYFPSLFGGEYIFSNVKVNPFTFEPMMGGLQLTPLRAYAHQVPRYYIQNFGSSITHPDTNEFAGFVQDTVRVTSRLALSLGLRYDVQTFSEKGLVANPLWPEAGRVPLDGNNFAPRVGLAYSIGHDKPLVIRAGVGWFYTRIPQIYTSSIANDNGLAGANLILDNADFYDHQIFPLYPNPLVSCELTSTVCAAPNALKGYLNTEVASFSSNFKTPKVQQASLNLEREISHRLSAGVAYMYVHGIDLIRARDVNLPPPTSVSYPVYDESGTTFLDSYYKVASFSTWQFSPTMTCPFPPCINPLARPVPQLGAINVFETASSSVYHGLTLSVRRQMTDGFYFRLAYTFAHAIDDGQDALVAGRPGTVQNSYATSAERASSVTDQRHRLAFSWVAAPKLFHRDQPLLGKIFNDWKLSGVLTIGSGRPVNARVDGDPNRDGNDFNDRLSGWGRNAFVGPDYATTDLRLTRRLYVHDRMKIDFIAESFNLFNRDNQRVQITDDGFQTNIGAFVQIDKQIGINSYPAHYEHPANFLKATDAYAPRQVQLALKFIF